MDWVISQIHAHAGGNTGDVYKKLQRLVYERKAPAVRARARKKDAGPGDVNRISKDGYSEDQGY